MPRPAESPPKFGNQKAERTLKEAFAGERQADRKSLGPARGNQSFSSGAPESGQWLIIVPNAQWASNGGASSRSPSSFRPSCL